MRKSNINSRSICNTLFYLYFGALKEKAGHPSGVRGHQQYTLVQKETRTGQEKKTKVDGNAKKICQNYRTERVLKICIECGGKC